jgi:hypothetical protein
MNKLLEELSAEFQAAKPPENSVTVRQFAERNNISTNFARTTLDKKLKDGTLTFTIFRGEKYYWEP